MDTGRRNAFARLFAVAAASVAAWRPWSGPARAAETDASRVAYHLSDVDRVLFVLGNIENHIEGMGGPQNVHIELVVHGPALVLFEKAKASPDVTRRLAKAAANGVALAACGNTMKAQNLEIADLLPGFVRVDEGGVVRLARLQAEGYAYLRP